MGNKNTCSRTFVDEEHTRSLRTLDLTEKDASTVRGFILDPELAPCIPGAEECTSELDECPICLLSYPSLNRTKCCSQPICTECFLHMKVEDCFWSAPCPFCKAFSYMVEYHGAKTAEERFIEQAEEQKVIETMIRIHQNELHNEKRHALVEDTGTEAFESETNYTLTEPVFEVEHARPAQAVSEMYNGGNLDLEDMMLMEAIWLSMQEEGETFKDFCLTQQTPTSSSVHEEGISNSGILRTEVAGRSAVAGGLSRAMFAHEERPASVAEGSVANRSSQAMEAAVTDSDSCSTPSEDGAGEASLMGVSAAVGALPVSFEDQIMVAMSLSLAEEARQAQAE